MARGAYAEGLGGWAVVAVTAAAGGLSALLALEVGSQSPRRAGGGSCDGLHAVCGRQWL